MVAVLFVAAVVIPSAIIGAMPPWPGYALGLATGAALFAAAFKLSQGERRPS